VILCESLRRSGIRFDGIRRLCGAAALHFFCHGRMEACQVSINFRWIVFNDDLFGNVPDFREVKHLLPPAQGRHLIACIIRAAKYGIIRRTMRCGRVFSFRDARRLQFALS
jgi:hypothetical protein